MTQNNWHSCKQNMGIELILICIFHDTACSNPNNSRETRHVAVVSDALRGSHKHSVFFEFVFEAEGVCPVKSQAGSARFMK